MKIVLYTLRAITLSLAMASPMLAHGGPAPSQTMFLRGTFNDWGKLPMTLDNGVWKAAATFGAKGQFKFDVKGDWTVNWGDNPPRDGIVDSYGANIVVDDAGRYEIEFDEDGKKYKVRRDDGPECGSEKLLLRGTHNGWGTTPMTCVDGKWKATATFGANGRFKFDLVGNWSKNYGDNPPRDGKLDSFGADIPIIDAGEYDIEVDLPALTYVVTPKKPPEGCGSPQMFFRGTPNGWGTSPMVCNPQTGEFEIIQPFAANGAFKFDVKGDWKENYGDNTPRDGKVESYGQNIAVEQAGRYVIRFNYRNKTYTVTGVKPDCGTQNMFLRGTFNAWKNDKKMDCVDSKWVSSLALAAKSQFKFDAKGDWSENYGDNPPRDGKVDSYGANIVVEDAGTYKITFDYNTKTYVVAAEAK